MTTKGQVFKAYAEAITKKHGFGSNKMVAQGTPEYISRMVMRGQRLISEANWAEGSSSISIEKYDAAMAGKEEGLRIWDDLSTAEKWLLDNGYLREYNWSTVNRSYHRMFDNCGTSIGLTDKGWSVAQKYIDSDY